MVNYWWSDTEKKKVRSTADEKCVWVWYSFFRCWSAIISWMSKPFFSCSFFIPLLSFIENSKVVFIGYSSHQTNQIPSPKAHNAEIPTESRVKRLRFVFFMTFAAWWRLIVCWIYWIRISKFSYFCTFSMQCHCCQKVDFVLIWIETVNSVHYRDSSINELHRQKELITFHSSFFFVVASMSYRFIENPEKKKKFQSWLKLMKTEHSEWKKNGYENKCRRKSIRMNRKGNNETKYMLQIYRTVICVMMCVCVLCDCLFF